MKKWESYEQAALNVIERFKEELDLKAVEGKQVIQGKSTKWEIDAKGIAEGTEAYVLIECRRYKTKKQNQEQVAAFAYRINDTGSSGGIIVSPLGLQAGAKKIAESNNIIEMKLHKDSKPETFMVEFFGKVTHGFSAKLQADPATMSGNTSVISKCRICGNEYVKYGDNQVCEQCKV